jgi:hypothetical protein
MIKKFGEESIKLTGGSISELRVTKGANRYKEPSGMHRRFQILWAAIRHLFTGEGMWLMGGISVNTGPVGITTETWIKKTDDDWHHWCVTFDGETAVGYVDGVKK